MIEPSGAWPRPLVDKTIALVGGATGIGFELARRITDAGGRAHILSDDLNHLATAKSRLPSAETHPLDVRQDDAVQAAFAALGPIDGLIFTAEDVERGPFADVPTAQARTNFEVKLWGAYRCVQAAAIAQDGFVLLFAGTLSRRFNAGVTPVTILNAAVEAFGRALAHDLAPVRVNVISPGTIASGIWAPLGPETGKAMMAREAEASPTGRVGQMIDVVQIAMAVIQSADMTGAVIDVDGGAVISQPPDTLLSLQREAAHVP